MSAMTRRAFCAVMRTKRLVARASIVRLPPPSCVAPPFSLRPHLLRRRRAWPRPGCAGCRRRGPSRALDLALAIPRVAVEGARGRELTELVPHGVLRDEDRDELAPVVNREREADH